MVSGFLVGIWIARYLGPEKYGWLNYALAAVAVIGSFTTLGINAIVVREIVRNPDDEEAWLGSAIALRGIGAVVGFLICAIVATRLTAPSNLLVLIVAAGLIFQAADVADLLFQANGELKKSSAVRMIACAASTLFKLVLLLAEAPLWLFAVAGVFEIAVAAGGWIWTVGTSRWRRWVMSKAPSRIGILLKESWPLTISGLAISCQAYIDQLILGTLIGPSELGQYSAALRLVSVFSFLPMILQTVAAPEITRAKNVDEGLYQRRLYNLYRVMMITFVLTAIPLASLGPAAARLMYGLRYQAAASLLPWLSLRLFFANFGLARAIFLTNESLLRFSLLTAVAGAILNILLNLMLIPLWGTMGAIAASFASFSLMTFGLEVFQPLAHRNLRLVAQAVFRPWRSYAG